MKIMIGKYEATIYPEDGGFTGAISLGFDAAGRRRRVKRKGKTKTQVKDKLRAVVADLESGITAAEGYTVENAVNDFFDQALKGKAVGTVGSYRSLASNNIVPFIGAAKLKKLTADDLDRWIDERAEHLSTRSLRLVHQILERAIRHAQARDKVGRNVASLVILPEGKQPGRPSQAMTLDQAVALLGQVGPGSAHRLAAYVVVSLPAGVRTEEARALTWADLDLDHGTLAVYRSVRASGDTKTRNSRRVLKLPTRAVESLKEHRKRQAGESLRAGEAWQDNDLVFARADGGALDRWQVRREFGAITQAAGLGDQWSPRELRHSFVSILSASGMRIEDISDLVGHSAPRSPKPYTGTRSGPLSPRAPPRWTRFSAPDSGPRPPRAAGPDNRGRSEPSSPALVAPRLAPLAPLRCPRRPATAPIPEAIQPRDPGRVQRPPGDPDRPDQHVRHVSGSPIGSRRSKRGSG